MLKYRSLGSSQLAKNATVAAGVKAAEAAEESRVEEIADAGGSSDTAKEKSRAPNMSSLLVTAVEETDKAAQSAQFQAATKRFSPRLEANKVSVMWLHLCFLY